MDQSLDRVPGTEYLRRKYSFLSTLTKRNSTILFNDPTLAARTIRKLEDIPLDSSKINERVMLRNELSAKFHVSHSQLPSSPRRTDGSASISGRPNFAIRRTYMHARVRARVCMHAAAIRPRGAIKTAHCSPFCAAFADPLTLSRCRRTILVNEEEFFSASRRVELVDCACEARTGNESV